MAEQGESRGPTHAPQQDRRRLTPLSRPVQRRNLLITLACFVLSLFAMRYLAEANSEDLVTGRRNSASYLATTEASRISSSIESYVHVTEVWESLIVASDGQVNNFDKESARLFDEYGAYLDAIVLAPNDVVGYVFPQSAQEGLEGVQLSTSEAEEAREHGMDDSYARALDSEETTVSGVVDLPQGGQGIVVHNPVYLDRDGERSYWGMVDAVIRFPDVFNAMGFGGLASQGYEYRLWREDTTGGTVVIAASEDAELDDPVQYTFDVPNGIWTLSLEPVAGWLGATHVISVVVVATSVSLATALLVYLLLSTHDRQLALKVLSYTDSLTGLANTRSYGEEIDVLDGQDGPYAVIAIDVNDFKDINDSFGHAIGDKVLGMVGRRLASCLRDSDRAFRVGGDEFTVVTLGLSDAAACSRLAERVRDALDQTDIIDGIAVRTNVSVGYARYPADGSSYAEVTHRADEAMYRDKQLYHASKASATRDEDPNALRFHRSATDPLTGLLSMEYYRAFCQLAMQGIEADGDTAAVAFIDIDNFKAYNLRDGYEAGDQILVGVAKLLREEFGEMLVARFDADHFVAVVALEGLEERLKHLHDQALSLGGGNPCELKCGVYVPADPEDILYAHDKAKLACDSLKGRFATVIRFYDEDLDHDLALRHRVTASIERALEEGWIHVWYQPLVRATTGEVCGAEALSRWIDPEWGMISPAVFIDELERSRLIYQLDRYVVRTVCHDIAALRRQHDDWSVRVSVNISRADFVSSGDASEDPVSMVEEAVDEAGINRSLLDIEITESAEVGDMEAVIEGIKRFRQAGYRLWVDDFGTGYSSFHLLEEQRFDVIKIDKSLLDDVETSERSQRTVSSIVNLAKRLEMRTVAEGVETEGQLAFMREIGADMIQGYLYHRPRPLREFLSDVQMGAASVETQEESAYFASLSDINLLSQSPLLELGRQQSSGDAQQASELSAARSFGVIEADNEGVRVFTGGPLFVDLLKRIGIVVRYDPRQTHPDSRHDLLPAELAGTIRSLIWRARRTGATEFCDFVSNGEYGTCQIRRVASLGQRDAFVLSIELLSGVISAGAGLSVEEVLHHLYALFDRIDVFDPAQQTHRNIYESAAYSYTRRENILDDALTSFAESDIHPDDRRRWRSFMDFSTAPERIARSGRGYVGGFFRTRLADESYCWQVYYVILVQRGEETFFLTCAKDALLPEADTPEFGEGA